MFQSILINIITSDIVCVSPITYLDLLHILSRFHCESGQPSSFDFHQWVSTTNQSVQQREEQQIIHLK